MRQRTGSIIERKRQVKDKRTGELKERVHLFARVTFTGPDGKRHARWRSATNRTHARDLIKELIANLDTHGTTSAMHERRTFRELADWFEPRYVRAAVFHQGRKISGLRSTSGLPAQFKMLRAYFGPCELRAITYHDLEQFKERRILTPVTFTDRNGKQIVDANGKPKSRPRSLITVNHELALLRRLFTVAVRENWLPRSPFDRGPALISKADEVSRTRVLSLDEERRLLAACTPPPQPMTYQCRRRGRLVTVTLPHHADLRTHLRGIIICAVDTGMRSGEIFKLQWRDVNLVAGIIQIAAMNTKTLRARAVQLTPRLQAELSQRAVECLSDPDALVFGITGNARTTFKSACAAAGITDLRFHDLRHTAATRMAEGGLSDVLVAKVLGHSQVRQTFTYVNLTETTLAPAAEILAQFQEQQPDAEEALATETVN